MNGQTVSHYRILDSLGEGGMGVVYRAEDTVLGRHVAIKFLAPGLAGIPGTRERFRREARAASALNHPNICTVYEVGEHDGLPFMAMELLEGETLTSRLTRGAIALDSLLEFAIQIADALAMAHAAGVVHRDIKPANLFVTADDRIKVVDFGIAKITTGGVDLAGQPTAAPDIALTGAGVPIGTVAYMSPEQARGLPVDARSDLFSFGIVLYEMATGSLPFPGATPAVMFDGILRNAPSPGIRPLAPALIPVIEKALEKDLTLRYQSAAELRADLRRIKRGTDAAWESGHHNLAPAAPSSARPLPRLLLSASIVVLLCAAAAWFWLRQVDRPIDSVAVLPFVNESGGEQTDYVSDGLPDSIINQLAQLRTLRVVPRTLVARYRGAIDLRVVARELDVRAVVTGSVRQHGNLLTIQAELIETAGLSQLWGDQFVRPASDILAVQGDISRAVVAALRTELSGPETTRLERGATRNSAAYELYLRGRYALTQRTDEAISRAIDFFEQAIAADPSYALAHAGLADAHLMGFHLPPTVTLPRAKAAAQRAITLDDTLAEAHTTLGLISHALDLDWNQAGRHFERAIVLNPDYAPAHHWIALYLAHLKQMDRAFDELRRARLLDPLSSGIPTDIALLHMFSRRYPQAETALREVLRLNPEFVLARRQLSTTYSLMGRHDEAIGELASAQSPAALDAQSLSGLGYAYARAGRRAEALRLIERLATLRQTKYVAVYHTAVIYAGLGESDQVLSWFERALEDRSLWSSWIDLDPRFDDLRGQPRFDRLIRALGLTP